MGYEVSFKSRIKGPISDGRIHDHVAEYEADVAEELAEHGEDIVRARLRQVLRNPTGYYESNIQTRQISSTRWEVHDDDIVYGPWLEGTGSRNSPNSIFPGYHTFSISAEMLKRRRGGIARRVLRRHRSRGRLT
jgi:hypothetical protein